MTELVTHLCLQLSCFLWTQQWRSPLTSACMISDKQQTQRTTNCDEKIHGINEFQHTIVEYGKILPVIVVRSSKPKTSVIILSGCQNRTFELRTYSRTRITHPFLKCQLHNHTQIIATLWFNHTTLDNQWNQLLFLELPEHIIHTGDVSPQCVHSDAAPIAYTWATCECMRVCVPDAARTENARSAV